MKAEISHVWVKEGADIPCLAILSDGSSYTTCLPAGRYDFEGHLDQEGRRFLRLRDTQGSLKIVGERELRGSVRRIYRRPDQPVRPCQAGPPCAVANVTPITAADRAAVKKWLRSSVPDFLPRRRLGRYVECGSVDSWTVEYTIERSDGEWMIRCEDPGGERDASGFADVAALVEDASDRGYDPEDLLGDLRRSRHPHLITLAHEVEEVVTAAATAP